MKKATIARFVIGLAAISAVGCSAETGTDGVGESSQALNGAAPSIAASSADISTIDIDSGTAGIQAPIREFSASCVIHDGSTDKLVVAGGFDSSGTPLSDILIYDPSGPSWTRLPTTGGSAVVLSAARGDLKGIQVPGSSNKCLFVGGSATVNGAAVSTADLLSVTGGTFAIATTAGTTPMTARAKLALSTCNGKVIAIGGESSLTASNVIEAWDPTAPASWANFGGATLGDARYDFALAKDLNGSPTNDRFVLAGGHGTGVAFENTVETITTGSTCTTATPHHFSLTQKLATGRDQLVGYAKPGSTNVFVFAGGRKSVAGVTSAVTEINEVTVTNWATPAITTATAGYSLTTATALPMLATGLGVSPTTYILLGGDNGAASPTPITTAFAQEWDSVSAPAALRTANKASPGITRGVAEYLPSAGKAVLAMGRTFSGSPGFYTGTLEITP